MSQAMEFFQSDTNLLAIRDVPIILVDQPSGILSVLTRADLNRDEVAVRGRESPVKAGFAFANVSYIGYERSFEYYADAAAGASPGRNPSLVIPKALAYKRSYTPRTASRRACSPRRTGSAPSSCRHAPNANPRHRPS